MTRGTRLGTHPVSERKSLRAKSGTHHGTRVCPVCQTLGVAVGTYPRHDAALLWLHNLKGGRMSTDGMTRREREDLAKLCRRREKVAKAGITQREAALNAQVEEQLSAVFPEDDPRWTDVTAEARRALDDADQRIAARCRELGIPERFRPRLSMGWYGRGENAIRDRRSELRMLAQRRIAALGAEARAEIEKASVEVQTALLGGGLETEAARHFLYQMPTPQRLMPAITLAQLEAMRESDRALRQGRGLRAGIGLLPGEDSVSEND